MRMCCTCILISRGSWQSIAARDMPAPQLLTEVWIVVVIGRFAEPGGRGRIRASIGVAGVRGVFYRLRCRLWSRVAGSSGVVVGLDTFPLTSKAMASQAQLSSSL